MPSSVVVDEMRRMIQDELGDEFDPVVLESDCLDAGGPGGWSDAE